MNRLINTGELCSMLRISRNTLLKLRSEGLPFLRVGNGIRFSLNAVSRWLQNKQQGD